MWVQKCTWSQVHHKICTNCIFTAENCPWSCDQSGEGSIFLFKVEYQQQQANTVLPRLKVDVYLAAHSIFLNSGKLTILIAKSYISSSSLRDLFPTLMSHFQTIWQTFCVNRINKMFILPLFACPAHRTTLRQPTQPLPLYSIAGPQGPFVEESRCCWICQNKNGQRMLINHFESWLGQMLVRFVYNLLSMNIIDCCWGINSRFWCLYMIPKKFKLPSKTDFFLRLQIVARLFYGVGWFCNSFERRQGMFYYQ